LSEDQQRNVVGASSEEFARAIEEFIVAPDRLNAARAANRETYERIFGASGNLRKQWVQFLSQSRDRCHSDGMQRKAQAFVPKRALLPRIMMRLAIRSAAVVRRLGLAKTIHALSPSIVRQYNYFVHGRSRGSNSYAHLQSMYEQLFANLDADKPVVIYAPMWKGVAASTEALFSSNLIRFPFFDNEYPEVEDHSFLQPICELLGQSSCKSIIFSGGS